MGQMDIGHCLGLYSLSRVHNKDGTLASGEAAGDLVGEIHMAGSVHEVESVLLTILGQVLHGDWVRLDRDAALALQIHGVQNLLLLVTVGDRVGDFQKTVRQGGLPVIDMGDDAEVADILNRHGQSVNIVHWGNRVNVLGRFRKDHCTIFQDSFFL